MKKLNVELLSSIRNTFASMTYKGEYKLVKKARSANETLSKVLAENGVAVAEVGSACPYSSVVKESTYNVSLGAALKYKHKVELATERNGVKSDYHLDQRDLGMFPLFGELIWCNSKDLATLYIRCYQVNTPTPKYYANGTEIKKVQFAQWANSDDYKKLSGLETTEAVVGDMEGNIIYAQDLNGNLILDEKGEPKCIPLPPIRAVKLENCSIKVKGIDLAKDIFLDEEMSTEELIAIRDSYYAKFH
jgi:hypothetical protein